MIRRGEWVNHKAPGSQTDVVQELFKSARYSRKERRPPPRRNYGKSLYRACSMTLQSGDISSSSYELGMHRVRFWYSPITIRRSKQSGVSWNVFFFFTGSFLGCLLHLNSILEMYRMEHAKQSARNSNQ